MFDWLRRWFTPGQKWRARDPHPGAVPLAYCEAIKRLQAEKKVEAGSDEEPKVIVFLNPLVSLLAAVERNKGKALNEREVLAVRNEALCLILPAERARAFYATLDAKVPIPRIDPERCWSQWQKMRGEADRYIIED
jgi:hypothetical protein